MWTRKPASLSWAAPRVRKPQASVGRSTKSSGFWPERARSRAGKKGTARARPRSSTWRACSTSGSVEGSQSLATPMSAPASVSRPTLRIQPSSAIRSASCTAWRAVGTSGVSRRRLGRSHWGRAPSLHWASCSPRVRSVMPVVGNSGSWWERATMMRSSQGRRSRLWPRRRWMRPRRGSSPARRPPDTKRMMKSAPSSRKAVSTASAAGGMARSSSMSKASSSPRATVLVKAQVSFSGKATAAGGMASASCRRAARSEGLVRLMPQRAFQGFPRVSSWGSMAPRTTSDCSRRRAMAQKRRVGPAFPGRRAREESQG